ncbi:MAG TPA: hypothetical protein VN684_10130 [Terriglobales bacterium]|nr:hypothetical protein [Terriglobales bacterium]
MNTKSNDEHRRLTELYVGMADGELEQLAADGNSLTDEAQDVLKAELDRRGLTDKIEKIPPAEAPQPVFQELVTIREFRDLPDALLAQGFLQSAGIECSLADDNLVRMDWFYSNAVGGIKLRVKPEDAKEAFEMLKQPIPAGLNTESVGIYEQPKCPKCGSLDITFEQPGWKCHTCNHEWSDENPETAE